MVQRTIEFISEELGRRRFMGHLLRAASIVALGLIGVPKAHAYVAYKCCTLCANNDSTCTSTCTWAWVCCHTDHLNYRCSEYYDPCVMTGCPNPAGSPCEAASGFKCSKATSIDAC